MVKGLSQDPRASWWQTWDRSPGLSMLKESQDAALRPQETALRP